MTSPYRILLLEDAATDAELVQEILEAEHFDCEITRVQTRAEFTTALEDDEIDLILADYKLPSFDGLSALKLALSARPDLPFIFVSGTLGEELAVEALKIGATDYVLKMRLSRLAPSVRRAMREAEEKAERKKAEEALRRSEEATRRSESELRHLIENIPAMVFIALPGASNAFVSRRWREYTGLSSDDTAGSGWKGVVHPDDLERHVEKWRACEAIAGPFEDEATFRRASDGEYRWFLVRAMPELNETRNIAKWYGVVTDIEDRKRAEEALHTAQAELAHVNRVTTVGQLAASIAHEVNQPITAAIANADTALAWLGRDPPDLEEVREALDSIKRDAHRAGDVIGRIRSLIKKAPPQNGRLDINDAILEVIALARGEVVKNCVSVKTQLTEDLPVIQGDRVRLQQLILNLIINATEAMSDVAEGTRELLVSTNKKGSNEVAVAVQDSGPGLPADGLGRIFEAFYTTKPAGMGMGLSICKSIVEAHGGRLWTAPNMPRGAVFQFTLPAQRDSVS